jgi:hypothetical protein
VGLLSWLLRRERAQAAVAALPPAPAPAEHAGETEAPGEISPARLDAALRRLREEHSAPEEGPQA